MNLKNLQQVKEKYAACMSVAEVAKRILAVLDDGEAVLPGSAMHKFLKYQVQELERPLDQPR